MPVTIAVAVSSTFQSLRLSGSSRSPPSVSSNRRLAPSRSATRLPMDRCSMLDCRLLSGSRDSQPGALSGASTASRERGPDGGASEATRSAASLWARRSRSAASLGTWKTSRARLERSARRASTKLGMASSTDGDETSRISGHFWKSAESCSVSQLSTSSAADQNIGSWSPRPGAPALVGTSIRQGAHRPSCCSCRMMVSSGKNVLSISSFPPGPSSS